MLLFPAAWIIVIVLFRFFKETSKQTLVDSKCSSTIGFIFILELIKKKKVLVFKALNGQAPEYVSGMVICPL